MPGIRGSGCNLMVRRDGQVARDNLSLGVCPVVTWWACAIHWHLWADTVDCWGRSQTKFRVHFCGGAWLMILSVGGTITGAVGFELQQFLLPLTFLQLHYADLQTHTRGSHYTRKRHHNNSKLSGRIGNEVYRGIQEKQNKYIFEELCTCSSKQCLCFSEICLRSACFSFNKLSRHKVPQSNFSSSHRDFSCKTNTSYAYVLFDLYKNLTSFNLTHTPTGDHYRKALWTELVQYQCS